MQSTPQASRFTSAEAAGQSFGEILWRDIETGAEGRMVVRFPKCTIGSHPDSTIWLPEPAALSHATLTFGKRFTLLKAPYPTHIGGRLVREWLIDEPTELSIGTWRVVVLPSRCTKSLANVVRPTAAGELGNAAPIRVSRGPASTHFQTEWVTSDSSKLQGKAAVDLESNQLPQIAQDFLATVPSEIHRPSTDSSIEAAPHSDSIPSSSPVVPATSADFASLESASEKRFQSIESSIEQLRVSLDSVQSAVESGVREQSQAAVQVGKLHAELNELGQAISADIQEKLSDRLDQKLEDRSSEWNGLISRNLAAIESQIQSLGSRLESLHAANAEWAKSEHPAAPVVLPPAIVENLTGLETQLSGISSQMVSLAEATFENGSRIQSLSERTEMSIEAVDHRLTALQAERDQFGQTVDALRTELHQVAMIAQQNYDYVVQQIQSIEPAAPVESDPIASQNSQLLSSDGSLQAISHPEQPYLQPIASDQVEDAYHVDPHVEERLAHVLGWSSEQKDHSSSEQWDGSNAAFYATSQESEVQQNDLYGADSGFVTAAGDNYEQHPDSGSHPEAFYASVNSSTSSQVSHYGDGSGFADASHSAANTDEGPDNFERKYVDDAVAHRERTQKDDLASENAIANDGFQRPDLSQYTDNVSGWIPSNGFAENDHYGDSVSNGATYGAEHYGDQNYGDQRYGAAEHTDESTADPISREELSEPIEIRLPEDSEAFSERLRRMIVDSESQRPEPAASLENDEDFPSRAWNSVPFHQRQDELENPDSRPSEPFIDAASILSQYGFGEDSSASSNPSPHDYSYHPSAEPNGTPSAQMYGEEARSPAIDREVEYRSQDVYSDSYESESLPGPGTHFHSESDESSDAMAGRFTSDLGIREPSAKQVPSPVNAKFDSPSTAAVEASHGDEEESIEAYMQKLLQRVKSGPDGVSMEPIHAPKPAQRSRAEIMAGTSVSQREVKSESESATPVAEDRRPFSPGEFTPRNQAPEKKNDLDALRELANINARRAITKSDSKRTSSAILFKVTVTSLAIAAAATILLLNGTEVNPSFAGMIAAIVVAILWGYDCLIHFHKLNKSGRSRRVLEAMNATAAANRNSSNSAS